MSEYTTHELVVIAWIVEDFDPQNCIIYGSEFWDLCEAAEVDGYDVAEHFETKRLIARIPGTGDLYEESHFMILKELFKVARAESINPRPRVSIEVAEIRAYQIAKEDPSFVRAPTLRKWSEAIGCSIGTVQKLKFYQACEEKAGKKRAVKVERTFFPDDTALAVEDEQLKNLTDSDQC